MSELCVRIRKGETEMVQLLVTRGARVTDRVRLPGFDVVSYETFALFEVTAPGPCS